MQTLLYNYAFHSFHCRPEMASLFYLLILFAYKTNKVEKIYNLKHCVKFKTFLTFVEKEIAPSARIVLTVSLCKCLWVLGPPFP
jgi:hypothetical protein